VTFRAREAQDGALVIAAPLVAAVMAVAGCGGASGSRHPASAPERAAAPPARVTATTRANPCVPLPPDPAAPGRYSIRRASAAMRRESAAARGPRRLDPSVWYPAGRPPHGCRFPLVLFSHGHDGDPASCSRLCAHLASQGFVVLAPVHPDRATATGAQGPERVEDLLFLLDHLPQVWRRLAPRLAGRVDARAVGVAGHSFGGRTAAELASQEPRVGALMTMAGGADRAATALIRAPTLMLAGGADLIDPARLSVASYRALPRTTPRALVVVAGAGHGAFTDGCAAARVCPLVLRAASALFVGALGHRPAAFAPLRAGRLGDPRAALRSGGF
jgi:predicted dienelactone hydrolase